MAYEHTNFKKKSSKFNPTFSDREQQRNRDISCAPVLRKFLDKKLMLQDGAPVFLSEKEITFGRLTGRIEEPTEIDCLIIFNEEIKWNIK